jgi:hypothetical protein
MNRDDLFIEVDFQQNRKHGQNICGDAFQLHKLPDEGRIIAVLSDGLGSGVKANILASMTASMACRFAASDMDFLHCAEIMMDALPVCQVRKISYATFTIVDCHQSGRTRIIEMDSPGFLLVRQGRIVPFPAEEKASPRWQDRRIRFTQLEMEQEDRLVLFTDGISQAGLGSDSYPLGWREEGCRDFVLEQVADTPSISARHLAENMLVAALSREPRRRAQDDMSAGVIYFRRPRRLLLLSGPPYSKDRDGEYARMLEYFDGKKVICGGTTATILGRELVREVVLDLHGSSLDLPPLSRMPGVDLVTEGILTLTSAAQMLEDETLLRANNPAAMLVDLMLESDVIEFVVGSRINEAHQDPKLPIDIEIRRNIIKRIAKTLEDRYLKEVSVQYI